MRYVILILILSALTHFLFFGYPAETVFDEVHFGKFISGYFTGEYFFDIHPPLAKLLISGMGYLGGFEPGFSFGNIGEKFPDSSYMWLRLLPIIAGVLLPLSIFLLARELNFSKLASLAAALFVIFENSILTQSLFILLDSLLLFFGFLGLLLYFKYKKSESILFLVLSAISLAAAFSIKWTGASFLALVIIHESISAVKNRRYNSKFLLSRIGILILVPLIFYFSVFGVHFSLLNKSGPGDNFMSRSFQKTLAGSSYHRNDSIQSSNIFQKFGELNIEMYKSNKRLSASHPYSSKWNSWPFMTRPIYYWTSPCRDCPRVEPDSAAVPVSRIYLIGNPLIYWLSFIGVIVLAYSVIRNYFKKQGTALFLLGSYFLNLLPFIFIGRVMFLYHYFSALIFAILSLAFVMDKIEERKKLAFSVVIAGTIIIFLIFAPLTYGLPLSQEEYNNRVWFSSWR